MIWPPIALSGKTECEWHPPSTVYPAYGQSGVRSIPCRRDRWAGIAVVEQRVPKLGTSSKRHSYARLFRESPPVRHKNGRGRRADQRGQHRPHRVTSRPLPGAVQHVPVALPLPTCPSLAPLIPGLTPVRCYRCRKYLTPRARLPHRLARRSSRVGRALPLAATVGRTANGSIGCGASFTHRSGTRPPRDARTALQSAIASDRVDCGDRSPDHLVAVFIYNVDHEPLMFRVFSKFSGQDGGV